MSLVLGEGYAMVSGDQHFSWGSGLQTSKPRTHMARASGLVGAGEPRHVWAGSRELQTVNEGRGTVTTHGANLRHTPLLSPRQSQASSPKTTQMFLMFNGLSPGPTALLQTLTRPEAQPTSLWLSSALCKELTHSRSGCWDPGVGRAKVLT